MTIKNINTTHASYNKYTIPHSSQINSIKIVDSKLFETKFKDATPVYLDMDEYILLSGKELNSLITDGVAFCLALGVRIFDYQGNLLAIGMGHFSAIHTEAFEYQMYQYEGNLICDFLNEATEISPSIEVFACGMYDENSFKHIQEFINRSYHPRRFEILINPWNMPQKIFQRSDRRELEKYTTKVSFSLTMGITKDGHIFVTDESEDTNMNRTDFLQFREERFTHWKTQFNVLQDNMPFKR